MYELLAIWKDDETLRFLNLEWKNVDVYLSDIQV